MTLEKTPLRRQAEQVVLLPFGAAQTAGDTAGLTNITAEY